MVQAMKLKNILIVVNDIQESICFYKEIFGLDIITKQEGNVILTEYGQMSSKNLQHHIII